MYLEKTTKCEVCLNDVDFEAGHVFERQGFFVRCPYCNNDVEVFDIHRYGVTNVPTYDEELAREYDKWMGDE